MTSASADPLSSLKMKARVEYPRWADLSLSTVSDLHPDLRSLHRTLSQNRLVVVVLVFDIEPVGVEDRKDHIAVDRGTARSPAFGLRLDLIAGLLDFHKVADCDRGIDPIARDLHQRSLLRV